MGRGDQDVGTRQAEGRSRGRTQGNIVEKRQPGGRVSVLLLRLRSRTWEPREWPRFREGARADERAWIKQLDDRELAQLAGELGRVDRAVREFHQAAEKPDKDAA